MDDSIMEDDTMDDVILEDVGSPDTQTNSILETNTETMTSPNTMSRSNSNPKVPFGQVSCLLCKGFVTVPDGDWARFVDHMRSHEMKPDRELILAVSVLTEREKQFVIRSAADRLDAMGRGRSPDFTENIFENTPLPVGPIPTAPAKTLARSFVPRMLARNSSISISKVDMSRPCNMCKVMLPSPGALAEHMKKNHFSRLAGINIQLADSSSKSSTYKPTPKPVKNEPPVVKRTPQNPPARRLPGQVRNLSMANSMTTQRALTRSPTSDALFNRRSPSTQNENSPNWANSPSQPITPEETMERSSIGTNLTPQQKRPNSFGRTPTQSPSKAARMIRMNEISLTHTGSTGKDIYEEAPKDEDSGDSEETIKKEVEDLQTMELLDNLANFLD